MRLIRLGLANVNSTVGAVQKNTETAVNFALALASQGAHLVAFPEQVLGGYPPEDWVQWPSFLTAQIDGLSLFAKQTAATNTLFALGLLVQRKGQIYNCAALVSQGRIWGLCPKEKLPLYQVFYESRTLSKGIPYHTEHIELSSSYHPLLGPDGKDIPFGDFIFQAPFGTISLEICEDLWSPQGPMRRRCFSGAELCVNLSASPFRLGISDVRSQIVNARSRDNHATLLYVNAVGGNDGLVFDGGGYVSQSGTSLFERPRFQEGFDIVTVDLDKASRLRTEDSTFRADLEEYQQQGKQVRSLPVPCSQKDQTPLSYPAPKHHSFFLPPTKPTDSLSQAFCEELLSAITVGIGDYFEKTKAFQCIGVALSGGRDSLLCLLLAHRYLCHTYQNLPILQQKQKIKELLFAFYMPSRYSSHASATIAQDIADDLGISLVHIPIDQAVDIEIQAAQSMLQPGHSLDPITLQNIQARIRGQRMWNWANAQKGLFLQTSNMSEKAVGYTTIGGDMMGAFSPIANVPKTLVNYLLEYLSSQLHFSSIQKVLSQPASAELAKDQQTEKDLMPFDILDACIALFVGEKMHPPQVLTILLQMFPNHSPHQLQEWIDRFTKLFTQSIYKWVQAPLSIHLWALDLDRERALQLPVVSSSSWLCGLTSPPIDG